MSNARGMGLRLDEDVGHVAAVGQQPLLGQYRAQLEIAEAALRAALDEAARAASAIREVEAELRRMWEVCHGDPPPGIQQWLEHLRNERAALTERKYEAQRASEDASLQVASARRAIEAAEERARRLRRQLIQETDAVQRVRRAIATTEQSLARQRDVLRVKEALLAGLHDELLHLTGELLA